MTGSVSWEALTFLVGIIVAVAIGVGTVIVWLWNMVARLQRAMADLRLEMVKEYATFAAVERLEHRIADAIKTLRNDFNAGFDRVVDMMKPRRGSGGGE